MTTHTTYGRASSCKTTPTRSKIRQALESKLQRKDSGIL